MITRDINIIINKDTASMDSKLYFYQGDTGVDIHFTIKEFKYGITNNVNTISLDDATAGILICDPDNVIILDSELPVIDNKIQLNVDTHLTDVLGQYKFQIHLYDKVGGRITIPPLTWEIKPLIGIAGASGRAGVVDAAIVGVDFLGAEEVDLDPNWISGEVITAGKLNRIETMLGNLDTKINNVEDSYDNIIYVELGEDN